MHSVQHKSLLNRVLQSMRRVARKLLSPWLHRNSEFERTISAQFMALRHELDIHQQALADLSQSNQEFLQMMIRYQREFEAKLAHAHSNTIDSAQIRDFLLPYIHELRDLQKRVFVLSGAAVLPFPHQKQTEAA